MSLVKVAALFETSLQAKIAPAATTMTLVNGTDKDGNTLTGLYGLVIDEGSANEEFVIGTVAGTAVTAMIRDIDVSNPDLAGTGKDHRRGASVKITDYPFLGQLAKLFTTGGTVESLITFLNTARPKLDVDVDTLNDTEFVTKGELSRTALGALTSSRLLVSGTAGENLTPAGRLVYLKTADSKWYLCDADDAATVENVTLGISQGIATTGNAIPGGVLLRGIDTNNTVTASTIYYASNTAGGISTTPGTKEVTIGISLPSSTTQLYFLPRFNQGITEDIQDALETTTSGTPLSSANNVVDKADVAENTASKIVRRKADGTIAGNTKEVTVLIAGESIADRDVCAMAEITESFATGTDTRNVASDTVSNTDKYVAQGFQLPITQKIYSGTITIKKISAPTKDVRVAIYSDTAGSPNASLGYYDIPYQSITTSFQTLTWMIPAGISITANTQYHIVVSTADLSMDSTNYYQLESLTSGTYAYGQTKISSNATVWNADGTRDCKFLVTYLGALKYDSDDTTRTYIGNLIVADAAIAQRTSGDFVVKGKKTGYGLTLYGAGDVNILNQSGGYDWTISTSTSTYFQYAFPMISQVTFLKSFTLRFKKHSSITSGTYTVQIVKIADGKISGDDGTIFTSTANAIDLTTSYVTQTYYVNKNVVPGAIYSIIVYATGLTGSTPHIYLDKANGSPTWSSYEQDGTVATSLNPATTIVGTKARNYIIGDYLYGSTSAGSFGRTRSSRFVGKLLDADTIDVGNYPTGNNFISSVTGTQWPLNDAVAHTYTKNLCRVPDGTTKILFNVYLNTGAYIKNVNHTLVLESGRTTAILRAEDNANTQTVTFTWDDGYLYTDYDIRETTTNLQISAYFYN